MDNDQANQFGEELNAYVLFNTAGSYKFTRNIEGAVGVNNILIASTPRQRARRQHGLPVPAPRALQPVPSAWPQLLRFADVALQSESHPEAARFPQACLRTGKAGSAASLWSGVCFMRSIWRYGQVMSGLLPAFGLGMAVLAGSAQAQTAPIRVQDDRGRAVVLAEPARRR